MSKFDLDSSHLPVAVQLHAQHRDQPQWQPEPRVLMSDFSPTGKDGGIEEPPLPVSKGGWHSDGCRTHHPFRPRTPHTRWDESRLYRLERSLTQAQGSQDGIYCLALTAVSARLGGMWTIPFPDIAQGWCRETGRAAPAKLPPAAVKTDSEHWAVLSGEQPLFPVPLLLGGQTFQWCSRHVWSCFTTGGGL